MGELVPLLSLSLKLILPISLLLIGLIGGRLAETSHITRLTKREAELSDMLVTQLCNPPCASQIQPLPPSLVVAEVVIATDYLKSFVAGIVNFFGGQIRGYERMMDRARREATCRLLEAARERGYNAICGVRIESADVGGNAVSRKIAMAAILATATAYTVPTEP